MNLMYIKHYIWERDDYICQYCYKDLLPLYNLWRNGKIKRKKAELTVDHVLPKSKGGTWEVNNLVTCCEQCNNIKGSYVFKKSIPTRSQKIIYRLLAVLVVWGEWAKRRRVRNPSHYWENIK